MPEFVYALHDFIPEHEDELEFKAGERIEIVEKDDQYGDGWWQGRSLTGRVGLFPQTYTTPSQPGFVEARQLASSVNPMQPVAEEDNAEEGESHPVMVATLTDVQEAIEQLGAKRTTSQEHGAESDADAAGSFSFASSQGETTDKELFKSDTDDAEADEPDMDPDEWHRGARALLAQNAQREMEKRRSKEKDDARPPVPLQNFEFSDESEPEEDERNYNHTRQLPVTQHKQQASIDTVLANERSPVNLRNETLQEDARETDAENEAEGQTTPGFLRPSSAQFQTNGTRSGSRPHSPLSPTSPTAPVAQTNEVIAPEPMKPSSYTNGIHRFPSPSPLLSAASSRSTHVPPPGSPPLTGTPTNGSFMMRPASTQPSRPGSQLAVRMPEPEPTHEPAPTSTTSASAADRSSTAALLSPNKMHPSEWTVDQVVEWLRSKNFDEAICERFTEEEITGDVLLELDATSLKSELGISAFGKRKRIENAILELRRPVSVIESSGDSMRHIPTNTYGQYGQYRAHARQESSVMSSLGSPLGASMNTGALPYTPASIVSQESPPHTGDLPSGTPMDMGMPVPQPHQHQPQQQDVHGRNVSDASPGTGLGITDEIAGDWAIKPNKPTTLNVMSSEGALRKRAKIDSPNQIKEEGNEADEERDVISEGEVQVSKRDSKTRRRRVFGRSIDSTNSSRVSSPRDSKELTTTTAATSLPGSPYVAVAKRGSYEETKYEKYAENANAHAGGGGRLSFFGGSLGKTRKPAPRFSQASLASQASDETEKQHHGTLGRFMSSSSGSRKISTKSNDAQNNATRAESKSFSTPPEALQQRPTVLRKKTDSEKSMSPTEERPRSAAVRNANRDSRDRDQAQGNGQGILDQIGKPDYEGWMRKKGERYNTWKLRYLVLKGSHLYYLRNDSRLETKIKGYINIQGYKVLADENVNPGRYGFRIIHDVEKPHFFSSEDMITVRNWMKALMKATIGRDYSKPVVSSCNIPTIPLTVAQAMNPAPRPPSPTQRDATQKALRRDNPHQLSSRDVQVLQGMPQSNGDSGAHAILPERADLNSLYDGAGEPVTPYTPTPPRPSRDQRSSVNGSSTMNMQNTRPSRGVSIDAELLDWANQRLPPDLQLSGRSDSDISYGLYLFRIAEHVRGYPSEPPVPNNAFPMGPNDERLEGLFKLFDMLLDENVKMGAVSINDVRQGREDKILQLLKALKAWEDRKRILTQNIGGPAAMTAGGWMAISA